MKLSIDTDIQKGIELECSYFNMVVSQNNEAILHISGTPRGIDYKHYYNGYSNYMTWVVAQWLGKDNEKDIYQHVRNTAGRIKARYGDEAFQKLGKWLKIFVENRNPLFNNASMYSDILYHTLGWVDYREIAEKILSE